MSLPLFLFDATTTIPEFLSWEMGVFLLKITEGRIYYHSHIPSLHPTSDNTNSCLVLSPHTNDEDVRDLRQGIGHLYDITRLYRLIFPDPVTHPFIHHSETCLWLLKEDWYTCFVQGLMGWVHIDPSQTSVLLTWAISLPTYGGHSSTDPQMWSESSQFVNSIRNTVLVTMWHVLIS